MRVFSFHNASRLHLLVSFPAPHEEIEVVCHCLSCYRPSFIDVAQQLCESVRQLMRKNELSSRNSVQRFYSSVCVHLARTRADAWTTICTVPKKPKSYTQVYFFLNHMYPFLSGAIIALVKFAGFERLAIEFWMLTDIQQAVSNAFRNVQLIALTWAMCSLASQLFRMSLNLVYQ